MKQLILVGNQKVKFQDTETIISLTLVADGNTVTIDSTKTYSVKIKNGTGYIKSITATPDTTNNMVTFSTSGFDGLPVDSYFIELWVIDTNGQTIYPSDSFIEVDITANATNLQGQVVPAITLQEFEDRFSTLQSDLEAKVGTLIGPTGATGNGISGVSTQYQLGTDGVNVPTGTWSNTPSTPTDSLPYMWTRNVTTYTDGSTHTSYNISAKGTKGNNFTIQGSTSSISGLPSTGTDGEGYMVGTELYVWTNGKWNDIVNMKGVQGDQGIQGIQGVKGDTGTGIQSTSTDYELSSQGVEVPNTGWSTTIPVTTNALPYLWTRVTITFTDSSQHVVYFTSNKGDKGDKGDTGEKGDTGANLSVKGAVDKATDLPSTGNSEGDAYLVGTDLYVYTNGAWKDCGPIVAENTVLYNADGSLNVNGTNFNYVQDLRNGKIQYNDGTKNVQVTPMDADKEASDVLAARTYTDTSVSALSTSVDTKLSSKANSTDLITGLSTKVTDNKDGTEQLNGTKVQPFNKLSDTIGGRNLAPNTSGDWQKVSSQSGWGTTYLCDPIYEILDGETYTLQIEVRNMTSPIQLETFGYNSADMWVVNLTSAQKADKDRKIIITFTANLPNGYAYFRPDIAFYQDLTSAGSYEYRRLKLEQGPIATDWTPAPEDKVNVTDMRKPASDVAGIDEVNAKQDKIGYTPADDSQVAHLSGANNFDTVPTVDNNPLLLASSLPSDLARTGSDQEFTGKNTFDTAPIDKTTGNPYITKSDVPKVDLSNYATNSQLATKADDSKVVHNTGTEEIAGQKTFDTAPIDKTTGNPYITKDGVPAVPSTLADTTKLSNFTAGLQSNGTAVATQTDVTTAVSTATANMADVSKANTFSKQQVFSTNPTNGTQVYPIYATADTDSTAATLIASLQSSGYSGLVGVPES